MYLCLCRAVTETQVQELGKAGMIEPERLVEELELDQPDCCGRCLQSIEIFVLTARQGADKLASEQERQLT